MMITVMTPRYPATVQQLAEQEQGGATAEAAAAEAAGGGGKRSRKSACPRRILQSGGEEGADNQVRVENEVAKKARRNDPSDDKEQQDRENSTTTEDDKDSNWEDHSAVEVEEKRPRRNSPPHLPPTPLQQQPQQPQKPQPQLQQTLQQPLQLPPQKQSPQRAIKLTDERPNLLRNLATLSPQSLIPTLYTALGGGSGGGGSATTTFSAYIAAAAAAAAAASGGGGVGGGASGDPRRPRGRPKGHAAITLQLQSQQQQQQQQQQHQQHQQHQHQLQLSTTATRGGASACPRSRVGGPRHFDPHAAPPAPVRIITRKGVAYNRRPRSFYSSEIKLSVIDFAEQHGASAAERRFNIPLSTVQSWMRHENKARIMRTPCDPPTATAPAPPVPPAATTAPAISFSTPAATPLFSLYNPHLHQPTSIAEDQPLNLTAPMSLGRIPLPSNR